MAERCFQMMILVRCIHLMSCRFKHSTNSDANTTSLWKDCEFTALLRWDSLWLCNPRGISNDVLRLCGYWEKHGSGYDSDTEEGWSARHNAFARARASWIENSKKARLDAIYLLRRAKHVGRCQKRVVRRKLRIMTSRSTLRRSWCPMTNTKYQWGYHARWLCLLNEQLHDHVFLLASCCFFLWESRTMWCSLCCESNWDWIHSINDLWWPVHV